MKTKIAHSLFTLSLLASPAFAKGLFNRFSLNKTVTLNCSTITYAGF